MAGRNKSRVPMQVSPMFERRIKELQKKIMKKQGKLISLRDLTENVVNTPNFDQLEREILNIGNNDVRIKIDKRGR